MESRKLTRTPILPGDQIASIEEFEAGKNAYVSDGTIRSTSVGTKLYDFKKRIAKIEKVNSPMLPKIGDIVVGHIEMLFGSMISVRILYIRSEEHTSELQSRQYLVCRHLLENTYIIYKNPATTDIYNLSLTTLFRSSDGTIRSTSVGTKLYDFKKRIAKIEKVNSPMLPKIGDIVVGHIEMLFGSMISVRILYI